MKSKLEKKNWRHKDVMCPLGVKQMNLSCDLIAKSLELKRSSLGEHFVLGGCLTFAKLHFLFAFYLVVFFFFLDYQSHSRPGGCFPPRLSPAAAFLPSLKSRVES